MGGVIQPPVLTPAWTSGKAGCLACVSQARLPRLDMVSLDSSGSSKTPLEGSQLKGGAGFEFVQTDQLN